MAEVEGAGQREVLKSLVVEVVGSLSGLQSALKAAQGAAREGAQGIQQALGTVDLHVSTRQLDESLDQAGDAVGEFFERVAREDGASIDVVADLKTLSASLASGSQAFQEWISKLQEMAKRAKPQVRPEVKPQPLTGFDLEHAKYSAGLIEDAQMLKALYAEQNRLIDEGLVDTREYLAVKGQILSTEKQIAAEAAKQARAESLGGRLAAAAEGAQKKLAAFREVALAATAAAAGLGFALGKSAQAFGTFEATINKVAAVSNASAADLDAVREKALQLGADTQFSARQAAEGFFELGKAGFSAQEQIAAMPGVLSLAAAAGISIAEAAEVTAGVLRGFGLAMADSVKVADQLAQAANSSAVDVNDLQLSLKYIAPVATAANQSLSQVMGAVALLGNQMIRGEQAGTSIRAALVRLQNPPKEAAEQLDALGISIQNLHGRMLPLPVLIGNLKKALEDKTDVQRSAALADIVGTEAVSAFMALVNAAPGKLEEMISAQERSAGASQKMADVMNQGLNFALEQLSGSIETLSIKIGSDLAPAIRGIAGLLTALTNAASAVPSTIRQVAVAAGVLTAAVLALVAAMGGLALALPGILAGAGAFATQFPVATTALKNFAGVLLKHIPHITAWPGLIGKAIGSLWALVGRLAMTTVSLRGFLALLGGPWGIAIAVAVTGVFTLIDALDKFIKKTDDGAAAAKKLRDDTTAAFKTAAPTGKPGNLMSKFLGPTKGKGMTIDELTKLERELSILRNNAVLETTAATDAEKELKRAVSDRRVEQHKAVLAALDAARKVEATPAAKKGSSELSGVPLLREQVKSDDKLKPRLLAELRKLRDQEIGKAKKAGRDFLKTAEGLKLKGEIAAIEKDLTDVGKAASSKRRQEREKASREAVADEKELVKGAKERLDITEKNLGYERDIGKAFGGRYVALNDYLRVLKAHGGELAEIARVERELAEMPAKRAVATASAKRKSGEETAKATTTDPAALAAVQKTFVDDLDKGYLAQGNLIDGLEKQYEAARKANKPREELEVLERKIAAAQFGEIEILGELTTAQIELGDLTGAGYENSLRKLDETKQRKLDLIAINGQGAAAEVEATDQHLGGLRQIETQLDANLTIKKRDKELVDQLISALENQKASQEEIDEAKATQKVLGKEILDTEKLLREVESGITDDLKDRAATQRQLANDAKQALADMLQMGQALAQAIDPSKIGDAATELSKIKDELKDLQNARAVAVSRLKEFDEGVAAKRQELPGVERIRDLERQKLAADEEVARLKREDAAPSQVAAAKARQQDLGFKIRDAKLEIKDSGSVESFDKAAASERARALDDIAQIDKEIASRRGDVGKQEGTVGEAKKERAAGIPGAIAQTGGEILSLGKNLKDLKDGILPLVMEFANFAKGLAGGGDLIAGIFSALSAAAAPLLGALAVAAPIIAVVVAALMTLVLMWQSNAGGIQDAVKSLIDGLASLFDAFMAIFMPIAQIVGVVLAPIFRLLAGVVAMVLPFFQFLAEYVGILLKPVMWLAQFLMPVVDAFAQLFQAVGSVFGAFQQVLGPLGSFVDGILKFLDAIGLLDFLLWPLKLLGEMVKFATATLKDLANFLTGWLPKKQEPVGEKMTTAVGTAGNPIDNTDYPKTGLASFLANYQPPDVKTLAGSVADGFKDVMTSFTSFNPLPVEDVSKSNFFAIGPAQRFFVERSSRVQLDLKIDGTANREDLIRMAQEPAVRSAFADALVSEGQARDLQPRFAT